MLLGLKDKLPFGKYKGKSVEEVIQENAKYLIWCAENISWFALTTEVQDELSKELAKRAVRVFDVYGDLDEDLYGSSYDDEDYHSGLYDCSTEDIF